MYTTRPIPVTLNDRFAYIIRAFCETVAWRSRPSTSVSGPLPALPGPLILLIYNRLRRIVLRFTRYATAENPAALCPRPRPRRSRAGSQRPNSPGSLPRNFAWLSRLVPELNGSASQLRHLLMDPELAALIEAAPTLGRSLRPLCHMLGIRILPSGLPPPFALPPRLSPKPRSAAPGRAIPAQPPPTVQPPLPQPIAVSPGPAKNPA